MAKKKIAISYAWKAKEGRKFRNAVSRLCEELRSFDFEVIRDVDEVKFGADLQKFMRRIGRSGKICVFLSDAYLRSENCMYELLIAFQRDHDEDQKLAERLRVFLLPDAVDYGERTGDARKALKDFWRKEIGKHKKLAKEEEKDVGHTEPSTAIALERITAIKTSLTKTLNFAFDHLLATDFDTGLRQLKEEYGLTGPRKPAVKATPSKPAVVRVTREKRPPKKQPFAVVFRENLHAINQILAADQAVADLFQRANSTLFRHKQFQVQSVNAEMLDRAEVNNTYQRLAEIAGDPRERIGDKQKIFALCGQLLVISMSPFWVSQQRSRGGDDPVKLPGGGFELSVGKDGKKTQFVNMLHLAAVAVAGHPPDLKRLFSSPREDDRALFDLPEVTPGITLPERRLEFQKFLIRSLLGAVALPAGITEDERARIDERFRDAVRMGQLQMKQGQPFYGTHDVQKRLEECLAKGTIPADCLVWLVGVSGELGDVMPQYFDTFFYLRKVYTALKNAKP
jgi:hypothetical protein